MIVVPADVPAVTVAVAGVVDVIETVATEGFEDVHEFVAAPLPDPVN